jgi:hypothetical protein
MVLAEEVMVLETVPAETTSSLATDWRKRDLR